MSTSPSWFDQEKFSRLAKKRGSSKPTGALPSAPVKPAPAEEAIAPEQSLLGSAPSAPPEPQAPIQPELPTRPPPPALVKPASPPVAAPPKETRSLTRLYVPPTSAVSSPALSGRLPEIKPIFSYSSKPAPVAPSRAASLPVEEPAAVEEPEEEFAPAESSPEPGDDFDLHNIEVPATPLSKLKTFTSTPTLPKEETKEAPVADDLIPVDGLAADLQEKLNALQKELDLVLDQRDQSRAENKILRAQLQTAEGDARERDTLTAQIGELTLAVHERDEARMECVVLQDRLEQVEHAIRERDALSSQLEELSHVIEERDSVRRDYASLREQYETLKHDRSQIPNEGGSDDTGRIGELESALHVRDEEIAGLRENRLDLERTLNTLKAQLAESQEQVRQAQDEADAARHQLQSHPGATATGKLGTVDSSQEIAALKAELTQARNEISLAQRGLALSQKALQETRDALREASEGTPSTKATLENLKKECSTLVQQNMLLQAQHDQVSRELSAAKAKRVLGK